MALLWSIVILLAANGAAISAMLLVRRGWFRDLRRLTAINALDSPYREGW
jgi:hypothetical protein